MERNSEMLSVAPEGATEGQLISEKLGAAIEALRERGDQSPDGALVARPVCRARLGVPVAGRSFSTSVLIGGCPATSWATTSSLPTRRGGN
jgi:hypothetical protein